MLPASTPIYGPEDMTKRGGGGSCVQAPAAGHNRDEKGWERNGAELTATARTSHSPPAPTTSWLGSALLRARSAPALTTVTAGAVVVGPGSEPRALPWALLGTAGAGLGAGRDFTWVAADAPAAWPPPRPQHHSTRG